MKCIVCHGEDIQVTEAKEEIKVDTANAREQLNDAPFYVASHASVPLRYVSYSPWFVALSGSSHPVPLTQPKVP